MMNHKLHGFTLVELMVTLSLIGILVSVGVPSFHGLMERNRLTTSINQFVSSLTLARSEAIKRKQSIAICASEDGATCLDGKNYEDGWIVYAENGAPDNVRDVNNEELLWVQESLSTGFTLSANINSPLGYSSSGRTNSFVRRVTLCKDDQINKARAITINATGRVHQAERNEEGVPIVNNAPIEDCN